MNKEDIIFVRHILDSIEHVESFSKNVSELKFNKSIFVQSAIIRELELEIR